MYGLIGRMKALPGQRDALAAILQQGAVAEQMPGCHSYVVGNDPTDPDALWITEVWDSRESHAASLRLPAVQDAIARGRPLIAGFAERFETEPLEVSHPAGVRFENATPILRVSDFDVSLAYYLDVLGFSLEFRDGRFCGLARGDASLMLSEGSQGCSSTWLYVGVSDADALHEELGARGARIRQPPTNYPWGSRELHVFDPDGHVLRFGSEAPPGEPFGAWLDEDGERWMPQPDGTWSKQDPAVSD